MNDDDWKRGRCEDFYRKWSEDPNWCEKCEDSVRNIENYMDLRERFPIIIGNLKETACKPLFLKRNKDILEKVISLVKTPMSEKQVNRLILKVRHDEKASKEPAPTPRKDMTRLILGDFREKAIEVPNNSVSMILTDPPYGALGRSLWAPLGELAARTLKPGGFLVTYSGQLYLPEILRDLEKSLSYYWMGCLQLANRNLVEPMKIYNMWKPLIIFYKPPLSPLGWFNDVIKGQGPEKYDHPWQQREDESIELIQKFSPPGGLILDPMARIPTTTLIPPYSLPHG